MIRISDIVLDGSTLDHGRREQKQVVLVRFFFSLAADGIPCELHTQKDGFQIFIFKRDLTRALWRKIEAQAREAGLRTWHPKVYWLAVRS